MKPITRLRAAAFVQRLFALTLLCACLSGAHAQALPSSCERPAQLRFSAIPQGGAQQDIASLQPLLDALESSLKIPVVAVESRSYGAVTEGMLSGTVDLARLGPASYVEAKLEDPQITAFASYARSSDIFDQESAAYYSLLIVKAGGPRSSLSALRGGKVALVDPGSTSGAILPRRMIRQQTRMSLDRFFGHVIYTGSHRDSVQALLRNEVAAAFVSSSHLSDLVAAGKLRLSDLGILWRSALIPRDPFVYRGQLCKDIAKKIEAAFLRQDAPHHESLLKSLNATRFVPVSDTDYDILRTLDDTD